MDVMNVVPAQDKSQTYVPQSLGACAKDGNRMNIGASIEDHCSSKRSPECCQLRGSEEAVGFA